MARAVLPLHQALGAARGLSLHIVDRVLAAMIALRPVRELPGVQRNRIDNYIAHLEPLNRGDAA